MNKTLLMAAGFAQIAATAAAKPAEAPQPKTADRPNVLMIVADDLGYGDLACYGARNVETPNVDRLASQGVRFTNAHAAAATSTPSRYGILTGEYPIRRPNTDVAAGNAGMIIRPEQFTMADAFKCAGYRTGAFGKWHLGLGDSTATQDWNSQLPVGLGDIGFDKSYIMAATADRVPCVFIEDGHIANFDPENPVEVSYVKNFEGEPTGRENPELLYNLKPSHGHDMSIVNGISRIGYMKGGGKALWKDENIADSIVAHAKSFMTDAARRDEPFFMYFCTNDVHVPRFPHDRFRGKNPMGLRGDAIVQFDWSVGEMLATLDSLGLADNTIVILTSDNGPVVDDGYDDRAEELLNGHSPTGGLRGAKYSAFEGGTRVPFIVRWPQGGTPEGKVSDALFSQIDLMRTFSDLVGARVPATAGPDSFDALPTMLGLSDASRPWVLLQAQNRSLQLRTPDWKYIPPSNGGPMITWGPKIETGFSSEPQLFDLKTDPKETKNVAPANKEQVAAYDELLSKIRSGKYGL